MSMSVSLAIIIMIMPLPLPLLIDPIPSRRGTSRETGEVLCLDPAPLLISKVAIYMAEGKTGPILIKKDLLHPKR
ncbi:hypothetical protein IWX49DRAFT_570678 [Phyllosticta citricarpa]